MEFEGEMKMAGMNVSSQQEAQTRMMIQRTETMDRIYLKYKLKLSELIGAVQKYDLENDSDVKALRAANNAIKMKEKKKMEDSIKLSADQEKMVVAAVEASGPLGALNADNVLEFDDFVRVQSLITKMGIVIMETKNVQFKTERRALLEDSKEAEYQKCIQQFQMNQKIVFVGVSKVVLEKFKCPMPVFQQTSQYYARIPDQKEKLDEIQQNVVTANQVATTSEQEFSKEETLKFMSRIEELKVDSMAQLQIAV